MNIRFIILDRLDCTVIIPSIGDNPIDFFIGYDGKTEKMMVDGQPTHYYYFRNPEMAFGLGFIISSLLCKQNSKEYVIEFHNTDRFDVEFIECVNAPEDIYDSIERIKKLYDAQFEVSALKDYVACSCKIKGIQVTHEMLFHLGRIVSEIHIERYLYKMPEHIKNLY